MHCTAVVVVFAAAAADVVAAAAPIEMADGVTYAAAAAVAADAVVVAMADDVTFAVLHVAGVSVVAPAAGPADDDGAVDSQHHLKPQTRCSVTAAGPQARQAGQAVD